MGDCFHVTTRDEWIATVHGGREYDEADARLIAAAPELLEALQWLLSRAVAGLDQSPWHDGLQNCDAIVTARNALNKAEGQS